MGAREHACAVARESWRDEDESLSTRSASRNAAASVGPPSRSSDWTPSAPSPASSSARGPDRSSTPSLQEAARARTRSAAAGAPPDVARVEPRVVPAHGAHPHGDRVRLRPQEVHEGARGFARHPARVAHATRPSRVSATLYVTNGRPSAPRSATPRSAVVHETRGRFRQRGVDSLSAKPLEATAVPGVRVELAGRTRAIPASERRRRREASCRGVRRARASRTGRRHGPARRLPECDTSACGPPLRSCQPSPTTSPPATTTAPTTGFGWVVRGPAPRARARVRETAIHGLILRSA